MRAVWLFPLLMACAPAEPVEPLVLPAPTGEGDLVWIQTAQGSIDILLFLEETPITTTNFLSYVEAGFYDGRDGEGAGSFYRAAQGFVLQGGGMLLDGTLKRAQAPIVNEGGISNLKGTVSMARSVEADSAASEFFINIEDNVGLDPAGDIPGYAVFGEVVSGWEVVERVMTQPVSGETLLSPVVFESFTRQVE